MYKNERLKRLNNWVTYENRNAKWEMKMEIRNENGVMN